MTEFWDTPDEKRRKLWDLEQLVKAYKKAWADGYLSAKSEDDYR
jgi:hypothetical protein